MGKIFVGQTKLSIVRTLGIDITNHTSPLIKYIKPSGETGQFVATVTAVLTGELTYVIQSATDLDQYGTWRFWAHTTDNGGKVIAGEPSRLVVFIEGEL